MIAALLGKTMALLGGEEGAVQVAETRRLIEEGRNPFSRYLPYLAYDPETEIYFNKDDTAGFMVACTPLWGESDRARKILSALVGSLPDKGTLSFHLVSLDWIRPVVEKYVELKKKRESAIIDMTAERFARFCETCVDEGIPQLLGAPLKNLTLIVSVKVPKPDLAWLIDYKASVLEQIKGCNLNPTNLDPVTLIRTFGKILNGKWVEATWNEYKPISSQIIFADTDIAFDWKRAKIGKNFWACVTPKNLPAEFDSSVISELIGPSEGANADGRQLNTHFIYSTVIHCDSALHSELTRKAGMFFNQLKGDAHKSIIGRLIGDYAVEHSDAVESIERGGKFYYVYPLMWLRSPDPQKLNYAVQRAKNLMEEHGFPSQEERGILSVLFLLGLPLGFNLSGREISALDRHFVEKKETAACLLPVVGDVGGIGDPAMLFISRKGQIAPFDPWAPGSPSKNCVVIGSTGHGKSFNMNVLVYSLYGAGTMIRIIDLGYSYKKQCELMGGEYIDFSADNPICLNPFTYLKNATEEEIQGGLDSISEMALAMAFEGSKEIITKEHRALVQHAVGWAWREWGEDANIDRVHQYLATFPSYASDEVDAICAEESTETNEPVSCLSDLKQNSQKLAFALNRWTTKGAYGAWFNGKSTIDLVSSDYIVLELERLKRVTDLLKIVSLAVLNAATASFYLADRGQKKLFLFEECGVTLKDNPNLKYTIEEMYRRVRKYNGAAITVFQGPFDFQDLGPAGKVIGVNSAYWFLLPAEGYESSVEKRILDLSPDVVETLKNVRLVRPRYGEIGLKTPWGFGVVRTVTDGFLYYLLTTDPEEWKGVEELQKRKKEEAIQKAAENPDMEALIMAIDEFGKRRDEEFKKRFLS